MTPLESVARALFKMFRSVPPIGDAWRDYIEDARTILKAIREPSEQMEDMGWVAATNQNSPNAMHDAWQAMIDAALKEG